MQLLLLCVYILVHAFITTANRKQKHAKFAIWKMVCAIHYHMMLPMKVYLLVPCHYQTQIRFGRRLPEGMSHNSFLVLSECRLHNKNIWFSKLLQFSKVHNNKKYFPFDYMYKTINVVLIVDDTYPAIR